MKKAILLITILFTCYTHHANAQEIIPLWSDKPLTNNRIEGGEKVENGGDWIHNISTPELHIYKAKTNPTGKAVVVCPGGGYAGVAFNHEGTMVAEWLNERGITAVILKYRMPNHHSDIPLSDVQEAIRYVRKNAEKLDIYTDQVGVMGFSAGGHLASTASTHYATGEISTRPDFSILFYPVITMGEATHGGSRENLLGKNPSASDIHRFSNEKQVTVNTPPTILLLSDDDKVVLPENSTNYYNALKQNDIPATMYIFPEGGHGWGFNKDFKYYEQMSALLEMWLEQF